MKNSKVITCIGNCQALSLTWYLSQLGPEFDVSYVSPSMKLQNLIIGDSVEEAPSAPNYALDDSKHDEIKPWAGKLIKRAKNPSMGVDMVKKSDLVFYQTIRLETSKLFNLAKLRSYVDVSKLKQIGVFHYNPNDPFIESGFVGMMEREKRHKIEFSICELIYKHRDKIYCQPGNRRHPNSFYFLELVRSICEKMEWDFYDESTYMEILEQKWPFKC
jgi:hypothetical protein